MTLRASPHSQREVVLDWQGLPWTVREAHATPYGFEVYKGYAGTGLSPALPYSWIVTPQLAQHVRTLRPREAGQLPFLACTVYRMRKDMGLVKPVVKTMSPKHIWTKQEIALLGTDTDRAIGEQLGLSDTTVQAKRASLGIPHIERWSPEQLDLLGQYSDGTVAKMLGMNTMKVKSMRRFKKIVSFTARQKEAKAKAQASAQAGAHAKAKKP